MATSRRGSVVSAHGSTDLSGYLPISIFATALVAGLPLWVLLGLGAEFGLLATLFSIALSFALSDLGARAWKRWPGSRDVLFHDLMLWGFCRRIVTQRRMLRRVDRLRFEAAEDVDGLTLEERRELIKKLAIALETGDPYTHGHSQRVARHAYLVAKSMKLPRHLVDKIKFASVIHDVGKLRIPREIITKPGKLTDAEFDVIKRHTVDGAAMVAGLGDPDLIDMVRHHHERLDGSGYPDKLKGEDISVGARVLAVADTFDAVSSLRPYRDAQKHQVALDILRKEADAGRLDPRVVDAFISYYSGTRSLRWWALLSAGPVNLYELVLSFGQRLGAASLANAAIVGVTTVGLASGLAVGVDLPRRSGDRRAVVSEKWAEKRVERSSAPVALQVAPVAAWDSDAAATRVAAGRSRSKPGKKTDDKKGRPDQAATSGSPSSEENAEAKDKNKEKEPKDNGPATGGNSSSDEAVAADEAETDEVAAAVDNAADGNPGVGKGTENAAVPAPGGPDKEK